jgi:hypothetical protein
MSSISNTTLTRASTRTNKLQDKPKPQNPKTPKPQINEKKIEKLL